LTYDNDHLPVGGTLVKRDLQLFIKRLRKEISPVKIKYYACGEYGDETKRPHYHLIVIGWHPDIESCYKPDRKQTASREIEELWHYGHNTVGYNDREAISYTVGYVRKKLVGLRASEYGEREPPFALQSQGIGKDYAVNHKEAILSDNGITRNGVNVGVPRYYRKKLIDKDSIEEYQFHKKCEQRKQEELDKYDNSYDHIMSSMSSRRLRRISAEKREELFKKGSL
jgi:hypothetical protein